LFIKLNLLWPLLSISKLDWQKVHVRQMGIKTLNMFLKSFFIMINMNLKGTQERISPFIELWCPLYISIAYFIPCQKLCKVMLKLKNLTTCDIKCKETLQEINGDLENGLEMIFKININFISKHSRPTTCTPSDQWLVVLIFLANFHFSN